MLFFDIVTPDSHALLAALHPPPEGAGKLVFGDGADQPLPARLEALSGQGAARQLRLHLREEEEVRGGEIRRIGRMRDQLDALRHQELLDDGGGVDGRVVPVEKPVLGRHDGPFLPENDQKPCQGLLDVIGVDSFAAG